MWLLFYASRINCEYKIYVYIEIIYNLDNHTFNSYTQLRKRQIIVHILEIYGSKVSRSYGP